jgi:hypothetical protein
MRPDDRGDLHEVAPGRPDLGDVFRRERVEMLRHVEAAVRCSSGEQRVNERHRG